MSNLRLAPIALVVLALSAGCIEEAPSANNGMPINNGFPVNNGIAVNNGNTINNGVPVNNGIPVNNGMIEPGCNCNDSLCFETTEECGHTLFVTFQNYTADFDTVEGADSICQTAAETFGPWEPSIVWKAVLSGTENSARDRIDDSRRTYAANGTPLAEPGQLFGEPLLNPPVIMANGQELDELYGFFAWSGSDPDGNDIENHCGNWTNVTDPARPVIGDARSTSEWLGTDYPAGNALCAEKFQLYCISQHTQ